MNSFIKFDLQNAEILLSMAVMNALNDLETGSESTIHLGKIVKYSIIVECLEKRGYHHSDQYDYFRGTTEFYDYWYFPNDEDKCLCIEGSVMGSETIISIQDE